jgi:NADH-quinone oxidoreductase subunit I
MLKGEGMLRGLITTIQEALQGERVTVQYPEQKRPMPARSRWRHVLQRYEDPSDPNFGMERCIG